MIPPAPAPVNDFPQNIVPPPPPVTSGGVLRADTAPPPPGSGFLLTNPFLFGEGFYFDRHLKLVENINDPMRWMRETEAWSIAGARSGESWTPEGIQPAPPSPPQPVAITRPNLPTLGDLAPGLQYLKRFHQFIVWKSIPDSNPTKKPRKVPCDYRTREEFVDPHDSRFWTDYDTAAATAAARGWGVGFVLTRDARVALLDYDEALMPDGTWHPTVNLVHGRIPRAAFEISNSRKGAHDWCVYQGELPAQDITTRNIGGLKVELFLAKKFIALGDQATAVGEAGTDYTAELNQIIADYFPPTVVGSGDREWTEGPCEGWSGPTDDQELIRRALNSQSPAAAFAGKASFKDLWEANEEVLGRNYPDPARAYDASSADMALAQHLAYWTGKDCARIERLMRMSALAREKWDDRGEYYLPRTINLAVGRQEEVCNDQYHVDEAKRRQEQIAENIRIGEGSDEFPSAAILTAEEMLVRYVHVVEGKRVLDLENPRRIFKLDEWKSSLKASKTVLKVEDEYKADGTPRTKSVDTTTVWELRPDRKQVDTVTFRPGHPAVTKDPEGHLAANTWRPIDRSTPAGDASLFLEHVHYLFDANVERFLDSLAHIEQKPGELPHSGWVHVSPMYGTGRNWLSSVLSRVWRGYVAASFDLAKSLKTGFDGRLSKKLLVIVDEINEGGSNARWENSETLKTLITAEHRSINPKFGYEILEYNAARWLIFSNHTSALPLTEGDRRFNVVRNEKPPMLPEYYKRLYAALKDPGFIAGVAELLRTRDISNFNPGAHAVMNEAKQDMVAASRSEADDVITDLVANHPADVIANSTLGTMLTGQVLGKMNSHHRHALARAGVQAYGQQSIRIGARTDRVQILRNHSIWKKAAPHQVLAELTKFSAGNFGG
jgi:primase-polymerase (primpol)-like protein